LKIEDTCVWMVSNLWRKIDYGYQCNKIRTTIL